MSKVKYLFITIGLGLSFSPISLVGQTTPAPTPKAVQTAEPIADYSLAIENEAGKQTKLKPEDLSKLKRQTIKVSDHGQEATFEGFALIDVLKLAGIEFGDALRGKRLATFLLVEATDDYQAVFALPELDPAFTDKLILLADKRDGKSLSEKEGKFRLVVPDEKKAGRWVRQVKTMKILRAGSASK